MSALQKRLLLLLALLLAAQTCANLVKYALELQEGGRFGGDFIGFWQAARRVRAGDIAAIYDPEAWRHLLAVGKPREIDWFVYPPFVLFGLWPLGTMTYDAAVLVWSVAPLPVYFALTWLLARRSLLGHDAGLEVEAAKGPPAQAYVVLAAIALPFLSANLFSGQTGAYIAALFLGAAYFWPRRPILAGICIGLLAVKPQLGLLLPFALLAAGQWRAIAAAGGTVVALVAASTAWLGTAIWGDYLRMTQLFGGFIGGGYEGVRHLVLGPYVSLRSVGAPLAVAVALQATISLAVLAVIVRVFSKPASREDERLDLRFGMLAAGALLATPYSLSYDTPMLVLAIIPLLARNWREGWDGLELTAVTALISLPFATPILADVRVPAGFGVLLLSFLVLWRRYRREGRLGDAGGISGV